MKISIIVAVSKNNVIGNKGSGMLWHIPKELKYFKKITTGHHILMGRKTHESIGHPLPDRTNLVLTQNKNYKAKGCKVFNSLQEAVDYAKDYGEKELIIIGGGNIYKQALPLADKIYLTKVLEKFVGDIHFPKINLDKWKIISKQSHKKSNIPFETQVLVKVI